MLGPEITPVEENYVLFQGKKLLYFGGTDYHRLSRHRLIREAAARAVEQYGLSSTGSRATTGNHPLYRELEETLARFFDTEAALVCASGYLANTILLQTIAGEFTHLFVDEGAHSSLIDAARQSGKPMVFFHHRNVADLSARLQEYSHSDLCPLILTDGVFPAKGEMTPLREYAELAHFYSGKLLIDDAHGMGVLGKTGRGSAEEANLPGDIYYQTGTLSKAFGTFGGIITGSAELIQRIQSDSAAFIGSTGLPLPIAAAATAAVRYLTEHPELVHQLRHKTLYLKEQLNFLGIPLPRTPVPIISLTVKQEERKEHLYQLLLDNGIFPSFNEYPGGPEGGHFRFVISSRHTEKQISLLIKTIKTFTEQAK